MEQLLVIIQQIYQLLNILNCYTQGEHEELLEGYPRFLSQVKELLGILDRIVGGSTYWGWKIEWGCQPWHLMTYRQQKGLTLQAGWEDKLELELPTDVCKLSHIDHERPVLFHELISGSSVSSSSVENNNEILELPVVGEGSDVDSMPELEDATNSDTVEIPLWLIPNGVMVTFRGGRVIFEREQGPPWQDVLTQMLEEQNSTLGDN